MDPIKEAFAKAKQDIQSLKSQIEELSKEIAELKAILYEKSLSTDHQSDRPAGIPSNSSLNSIIQHINPAHQSVQSLSSSQNQPLQALKTKFTDLSIGNRGVPTDRQTNQQTDKPTQNTSSSPEFSKLSQLSTLLDSLDSLKSDLKNSFKSLTKQELLIFSTIYQLDLEGFAVDYSILASKLKLSQSSIRDYTQKLIKKGIPLSKTKENNKKVYLKIPQDIQKIASLQAILSLKDI